MSSCLLCLHQEFYLSWDVTWWYVCKAETLRQLGRGSVDRWQGDPGCVWPCGEPCSAYDCDHSTFSHKLDTEQRDPHWRRHPPPAKHQSFASTTFINHTPLTLSQRRNSSNKQAIFSIKIDYPISNSFKASSTLQPQTTEILRLRYLNKALVPFSFCNQFLSFIFKALERVAQQKAPFSLTPLICFLFSSTQNQQYLIFTWHYLGEALWCGSWDCLSC